MTSFSPEDRALFEDQAAALYEEAISEDGLADDDPRFKKRGDLHDAFELLSGLGLLIHDQEAKRHRPVDPSAVQSRVVAPMSQQGAELISESAHWAQSFGNLAHAWRRSPAASRGPFTELQGPAITEFIAAMVADAEWEMLTAQPQTGRSTPKQLADAAQRDATAIQRGMKMRTLYQHSARRSATTQKYVAHVTAVGGEVRTLDEFFNRLIVVDRRIAIIPGKRGALAVREPMVVDYLVDVFERHWERARPYASRENRLMREVAKRAAGDDDPDAHRGPRRPEQRQAPRASARARTPATSPTSRRSTRPRPASSSATRWAGSVSRARRRTTRRRAAPDAGGVLAPRPRDVPRKSPRGQRSDLCPRATETRRGDGYRAPQKVGGCGPVRLRGSLQLCRVSLCGLLCQPVGQLLSPTR